jgi:phage/plasmid-associated DNA primase
MPSICITYTDKCQISKETCLVLINRDVTPELNNLTQTNKKFAIFLASSKLPKVNYSDSAVWRRMQIIKLTQNITYDDIDKTGFIDEMKAKYQSLSSYVIPSNIIKATKEARELNFDFNEFIQDCCVLALDVSSDTKSLYDEYRRWHRDNFPGKQYASYRDFIYIMKSRYVIEEKKFIGISLI